MDTPSETEELWYTFTVYVGGSQVDESFDLIADGNVGSLAEWSKKTSWEQNDMLDSILDDHVANNVESWWDEGQV